MPGTVLPTLKPQTGAHCPKLFCKMHFSLNNTHRLSSISLQFHFPLFSSWCWLHSTSCYGLTTFPVTYSVLQIQIHSSPGPQQTHPLLALPKEASQKPGVCVWWGQGKAAHSTARWGCQWVAQEIPLSREDLPSGVSLT